MSVEINEDKLDQIVEMLDRIINNEPVVEASLALIYVLHTVHIKYCGKYENNSKCNFEENVKNKLILLNNIESKKHAIN